MAEKSKNEEKGTAKGQEANSQEVVWPYITLVTTYYILLGSLLISNLVAIWPADLEAAATATEKVRFLFRTISVTNEIRMFLIVTMTGALGSLVHGFRSLFWYVGNRAYARSWTLMYLLLPFVGSTLSLVFYFCPARRIILTAGKRDSHQPVRVCRHLRPCRNVLQQGGAQVAGGG